MKPGTVNFFGTVMLLAATFLCFEWSGRRPPEYLAQPLETVGNEINGWMLDGSQPLEEQTLRVLSPTNYLSRSYRKNGQRLGLFIAFYAQQRAGESMHSPKNCLPGSGWEIWKKDLVNVPVKGASVQINKYFIQNAEQRLIVFYWYQSRDRIVANEYFGKMLLIRDSISDGSTAGSLVRVTVPDDPELAAQALDFSMAVIPQLQRCFRTHDPKVKGMRS